MVNFSGARLQAAALALLTGTLAACTQITESNQTSNRYGAINITARSTTATRAAANATGIFFEAFTVAVPNSALQRTDACAFAAYDTTTTASKGVGRAGNELTLNVGTTPTSLTFSDALLRYANATTNSIAYSAGETAVLQIPGATSVFPAASISVPLAEPVLPGAIAIPAFGTPLAVRWNASSDTTTAVLLSLRYSTTASATLANEQIFCTVRDDGSYDIPSSALTTFLASPAASRSLQITRWRTREQQIDARTILHIASSLDTIVRFP